MIPRVYTVYIRVYYTLTYTHIIRHCIHVYTVHRTLLAYRLHTKYILGYLLHTKHVYSGYLCNVKTSYNLEVIGGFGNVHLLQYYYYIYIYIYIYIVYIYVYNLYTYLCFTMHTSIFD